MDGRDQPDMLRYDIGVLRAMIDTALDEGTDHGLLRAMAEVLQQRLDSLEESEERAAGSRRPSHG